MQHFDEKNPTQPDAMKAGQSDSYFSAEKSHLLRKELQTIQEVLYGCNANDAMS